MALTNERILQEISEAMKLNGESKKKTNEALTHAMTAIQNMDKRLAEEYERGCIDAWDLARDITVDPRVGGYTHEEIVDIFGIYATPTGILDNLTYAQAIEKVQAYEDKKEKEAQKIVRGDEVEVIGYWTGPWTGVVVGEEDDYYLIASKHEIKLYEIDKVGPSKITKTGRHVDLFGVKNN